MKISNSFKNSTLNLKLLESKRPFLLFADILSTKLFPQLKLIYKTIKIKSYIRKDHLSNTQIWFCIFYSDFPKTFFILKMSKNKSPNSKWAPFKYSTWKFSSQIDHTVFLPNIAQSFLYTQNDQTKRKNLLNAQNGNFQVK